MATTAVERPEDVEASGTHDVNPTQGPSLELGLSLVLAAVAFAVGSRVITDNSFLTHLTTGDLIRAEGGVPTTDPYSWTAAGEPWTVQSWLASLIYSWVGGFAGGGGIRLLNGALTLAVVAGLTSLVRRHRASLLSGAVAVGLSVAIGATMWTPRPLLFGLAALTAVLVALLPAYEHGRPAAVGLAARPWLLVPIAWVWVQTHGSFPLAVVLGGLVVAGAALDRREVPLHELTVCAWVGLGLVLGAVNPLGLELLVFPFRLLGNSEALEGVSEWGHIAVDRPVEWIFVVSCLLCVLALVRRVEFRLSLPALVFGLAGLWAVRNIGVATVVAAPAVAAGLRGLPSSLDGADRSIVAKALTVLGGVVLAALAVVVPRQGALDLARYPGDATAFMVDHGLAGGEDDRILQRDVVGNYLHYRLGTEARVFVDDRFDFYPLDVLEDHRLLLLSDDEAVVAEIIGRRAPTAVLWQSETVVADWLDASESWDVVFRDDDWVVATPAP